MAKKDQTKTEKPEEQAVHEAETETPQTEQEKAETAPEAGQEAPEAGEEKEANEPAPEPAPAPEAPQEAAPSVPAAREEGPASELQSLSELANRHRVASWQQAALVRFMGWADGKMLTDEEYMAALNSLAKRHTGGGRRK